MDMIRQMQQNRVLTFQQKNDKQRSSKDKDGIRE